MIARHYFKLSQFNGASCGELAAPVRYHRPGNAESKMSFRTNPPPKKTVKAILEVS